MTEHGFKDAVTDPDQIEVWWIDHPEANLGLATAGMLVVDVDGKRNRWMMDDPDAAQEQITWEYYALNGSDCVSFWFCRETICPIVLFELGACMERKQDFIVGMDPDYQRRQDVEIQVGLRHPGKIINLTLDDQAHKIRDFVLLFDD